MKRAYTYNTNALEGEDSGAKEEGQLRPAREVWHIANSGHIATDVIECNAHTSGDQNIRHHRERR